MPKRAQHGRAALAQGPAGEIFAVELEHVEHAIEDRVGGHPLRRWPGDPETLLQPAEGRLLAVVGDQLAVDQHLPRPLVRHRCANLRVGAGQVFAGARLQAHRAAFLARRTALAVELSLEQPLLPEIATIGQRRQHQRDWHGGRSAASATARRYASALP